MNFLLNSNPLFIAAFCALFPIWINLLLKIEDIFRKQDKTRKMKYAKLWLQIARLSLILAFGLILGTKQYLDGKEEAFLFIFSALILPGIVPDFWGALRQAIKRKRQYLTFLTLSFFVAAFLVSIASYYYDFGREGEVVSFYLALLGLLAFLLEGFWHRTKKSFR